MKNRFIIVIIGLFLFSNTQLSGQDGAIYNLYNFESVILNPAGVGLSQNLVAFVDYRKQWAGIQGAPEMISGAVHGLVMNNMGAGLNFSSYKSSIFNTFTASLNYAYIVKISEDQVFIPGIFVGIKQRSLNTDMLSPEELADPAIASESNGKVYITSGLGGRYKFKDLTVDFAIPNLYSTEGKGIAQEMLGFVAYDFYTKDDVWRIQPSVLYRYEQPESSLIDVSFMVEYNKMIWLQVAYRTNKDVNLMLGVTYKDIGFVYNYSMTNSGMENISNGSHEVAIRYTIPYSIVK